MPKSQQVRAFERLTRRFLVVSRELFPQEASELGFPRYEDKLGGNTAETHHRYIALMRETLSEIERLPEHAFTGDDWLDRRGFLSMLRTGLLQWDDLARWRTNPQVHCDAAVGCIFDLVVRYAGRLSKGLPKIENRLARIPRFLKDGAGLVRKPVPLWTKLAGKTCQGALTFLTEVEAKLTPLSRDPKKTAGLFSAVRTAFTAYAKAIAAKLQGAPGGFAIGRANLEMLVRERLGLPYSLPEIEATGWMLIGQLEEEIEVEARKFGRKSAGELILEAAKKWEPEGGSLLEEYEYATKRMRTAFEKKGLLTLPQGEKLRIMQVPDFLEHQFPTAAYRQPGPFARDQTGIFWVNDLSAAQNDPVRKRAEVQQHFGLELTCAHEAYPGHHVQFVIQNQHPSHLRRLFAHAIFYEGWTLWCERMCVEHRIYTAPEARLMQLHDALWRACRIVIDCGLHAGTLTYTGAVRLLVEKAGFTRARAEGDVNWYTSSPSVPMSYLLGRLELERLHARLTKREGWTIRQFNDHILSFGAIPWSWIWEAQLRAQDTNQ